MPRPARATGLDQLDRRLSTRDSLSPNPPMAAVASGTRRVAWQAGPREGIPGVC